MPHEKCHKMVSESPGAKLEILSGASLDASTWVPNHHYQSIHPSKEASIQLESINTAGTYFGLKLSLDFIAIT